MVIPRRKPEAEQQTWAGGGVLGILGMGQMVARRCPVLPCISSCREQPGPQSKVEDMARERGQGEGEDRDAGKM